MKISLIELGGSHDEVLYTQAALLKSAKHQVLIIASESLRKRIESFDKVDKFIFLEKSKGFGSDFSLARNIQRIIKTESIDKVIFNTAHGKLVRDVVLFPNRKVEHIGIVHNIRKLSKSLNQQIISLKIKKYLVLNEYMLENQRIPKSLQLNYFYPIIFPFYKKVEINKPNDEMWICIPGLVEKKRRDYEGLLKLLRSSNPGENVKFILLGRFANEKEHSEIIAHIKFLKMENRFVLFDRFIKHDEFHSYLAESDIILPLLHPDGERFHEYSQIQISGSFNLAFGHQKPMMLVDYFQKYNIFRETSFFYTKDKMIDLITQLSENRKMLGDKSLQIKKNKKFNFDEMKDKFNQFVVGK